MTGPEHYKQGEAWLFKAEHPDARGPAETTESCAAIAEVHATLALAAATVGTWVDVGSDREWREAVSP